MKTFFKNFAKAIGNSDGSGGSSYGRSSEADVLLETIPFEAKTREQFPCKVIDYSSFYNDQGNNDTKQSWGPGNVIGPCTCYPAYGDNVTAWCPAGSNGPEHIIVEYEHPVLAKEIHVYENLGIGSTCKISCKVYKGENNISNEWIVLWEDNSVVTQNSASTARDFSPSLSQLVLTKTIRVDLKITATWSEIDTIKLVGNYGVDREEISELGSEYKQLFDKAQENYQTYSDVTISLLNSDKQIYSHKGLIASRSPYLLKQLTIHDGGEIHLELDVSFENLKEAIIFLYCNHCNVNVDNVFELFRMAKVLECKDLEEFCEENFTLLLTPSNLKKLYNQSVQQNNQVFVDAILRIMAKHYQRIQQMGLIEMLSSNNLATLKNLRRTQ